ncbi:MAG: hypothetical protein IJI66_13975 [Erysipelotrichaceae bacterium]|nr:hypothetical protein [Erysipelotrichaceae bacterium]
MALKRIVPQSFGNINNFDRSNPFVMSKQMCSEYLKNTSPYYEVLDKKNLKAYEKILERYKDLFLSSVRRSEFGNIISARKLKEWEKRNVDNAYKEYGQKVSDIFRAYIPDVKGYQYADEWSMIHFYVHSDSYESDEYNKIRDIALPIAMCILDNIYLSGSYDRLTELLDEVTLRDEMANAIAPIRDSFHMDKILYKAAQVVYDHNIKHPDFNEEYRICRCYNDHKENDDAYGTYRKMISLIDKNRMDRLIDEAENTGMKMYELSIKMIAGAINKLPKMMADADRKLEKIREYISRKPEINQGTLMLLQNRDPLEAIKRLPEQEFTGGPFAKETNMMINHIDTVRKIEMIRSEALDLCLKYRTIAASPDNMAKWLKEDKTEIEADLDIERINIENPFDILSGIIFAIEKGKSFPYIYNIYQQLFALCVDMLPWNFSASKAMTEKIRNIWNGDEISQPEGIYDKKFKSEGNDDADTEMNFAQFIYTSSGILLPRVCYNTEELDRFIEGLNIKNDGKLLSMFSAALSCVRKQRDMAGELADKGLSKLLEQANKEAALKADENAKMLKNRISELEKINHKLKTEKQDALRKHDELLNKYEADMKELAQLRENLFLSQEEVTKEETIEEALPYRLRGNVAVYGGHEKWIARLKESLDGDIRFYPPATAVLKSQLMNADIVYIQTTYIDHKTYYAVMNLLKAYGIKFVCLNTTSANNAMKIMIENDRKEN